MPGNRRPQKSSTQEVVKAANATPTDVETQENLPLLGKGKSQLKTVAGFGPVAWLDNLRRQFGLPLLLMLACSQHAMKGFQATFVGVPAQYLYASYGVAGPRMQIFGGVTSLPWAMKPLMGLVSDFLPIAGYHKAPYVVLSAILGFMGCLAIGLSTQSFLTAEGIAICLFAIQFQLANIDLLTEAKYAEKMRSRPEHGPDLMSYVWGGLQMASLAAVAMVGRLMKAAQQRGGAPVVGMPVGGGGGGAPISREPSAPSWNERPVSADLSYV